MMSYPVTWKNSSHVWADIQSALKGDKKMVVFDLETTGLSPVNERIIEIAAILYELDDEFNMTEKGTFHKFINPGRTIPDKVVSITGITDAKVRNMPIEQELFPEIQEFFGNHTVAGYNIDSFDVKFMKELYGRMGEKFCPSGTVDGIKMARDRVSKDSVENYKLHTIADYFGISFHAHEAIEDARATAKLIQLLLKEYVQSEKKNTLAPTGVIRPVIERITFWEGFRGFSRQYITTEAGSIYYDIRSHSWGSKDIDLNTVDMKWFEAEAWRFANCQSEEEFAKFRGTAA